MLPVRPRGPLRCQGWSAQRLTPWDRCCTEAWTQKRHEKGSCRRSSEWGWSRRRSWRLPCRPSAAFSRYDTSIWSNTVWYQPGRNCTNNCWYLRRNWNLWRWRRKAVSARPSKPSAACERRSNVSGWTGRGRWGTWWRPAGAWRESWRESGSCALVTRAARPSVSESNTLLRWARSLRDDAFV